MNQGTEIHSKIKLSARTIKRSRKRNGLTQRQLAKKMHVHFTAISKYENGHRHLVGKLAARAIEILKPTQGER